jgi:hypothetical protein
MGWTVARSVRSPARLRTWRGLVLGLSIFFDVCFRDFVIRKMREGLIGPKISYTAINSIVNLAFFDFLLKAII